MKIEEKVIKPVTYFLFLLLIFSEVITPPLTSKNENIYPYSVDIVAVPNILNISTSQVPT